MHELDDVVIYTFLIIYIYFQLIIGGVAHDDRSHAFDRCLDCCHVVVSNHVPAYFLFPPRGLTLYGENSRESRHVRDLLPTH